MKATLTHVCPHDQGRRFTSAKACDVRMHQARQLTEREAAVVSKDVCRRCTGPVPLPAPREVEGFAGPAASTRRAKTKTGPEPEIKREEKKVMSKSDPRGKHLSAPEVRAKAAESRRRNMRDRKKAEQARAMAARLTPRVRSRRDELAAAIADPAVSAAEIRTTALNLITMLDAMGATGGLPGWEEAA